MKKLILIILLAGIVIGGLVFLYVFRKSDNNAVSGKPAYTLQADSLVAYFDKNEDAANKIYNNKIIQVKGIVAEITKDSVSYNIVLRDNNATEGVSCTTGSDQLEKAKSVAIGKIVEIKGICFGKNLIDVSLNKCAIVEK